MERGLLVDSLDEGGLGLGSGEEVRLEVELEACVLVPHELAVPLFDPREPNAPLAIWFSNST